jgi:chromosome segregation ATPase
MYRTTLGNRADYASSQGSNNDRGRYRETMSGEGDDLVTNDLEAKLKNAQKSLVEVQKELEEQKAAQDELRNAAKRKEMPGGNAVQHALMADLIQLKEHCQDIDKTKTQKEIEARQMESELMSERDQRKADIKAREESERLQAKLQERIDALAKEAKDKDARLDFTSKDTDTIKKTLEMIQSERDETLELLRRAVAQKEKLKAEKQREGQQANDKLERLYDQQKNADNKVRELLSNVDTLLGKFSSGGAKKDTSAAGTQLQLELMKIRDNIRHLVTANEQTSSVVFAKQQSEDRIPRKRN